MKNYKTLLFTLLLYGLTASVGLSQEYIVTKEWIGVEHGLSSNYIKCVYQDQKGFVWLSTSNFINRYDGEQFDYFQIDTIETSNEISINQINEDVNGELWLSQAELSTYLLDEGPEFKNILLFNPVSGIIKTFSDRFKDAPFLKDKISTIHQDANYMIWFGLSNGEIWTYDGVFQKEYEGLKGPVFAITTDLENRVYVANRNTVHSLDAKKNLTNSILVDAYITDQWVSEDGTLWIHGFQLDENSTENVKPILRFKKQNDTLRSFFDLIPMEYSWIMQDAPRVKESPEGDLWMDTYKGILVFDKLGKLKYDLRSYLGAPDDDKSIKIGAFSDNLTWVMSGENDSRGLILLAVEPNRFTKLLHNGFPAYSTRGITSLANGNLLVATYRGVVELDWDSLSNFESIKLRSSKYYYGYGLASDEENIYLGKHGKELYNLDKNGNLKEIINAFIRPNEEDIPGDFYIPFIDRRDRLWVGTDQGILYFDTDKRAFKKIPYQSHFSDLEHTHVRHFYENEQGIWICTSSGLFLMNGEGEVKAHHNHLPSDKLNYIYEDTDGLFWIGTISDGLISWNRKIDSVQHFTRLDGLSDLSVHAIFEDDFEYLWISSNSGLMRYDRTNNVFRNFYEKDGLAHNEFNRTSFFKDKKGRIYFGGLNGITTFHPADFLDAEVPSDLSPIITNLEVLNVEKGTYENHFEAFNESKALYLKDQLKTFKVDFSFPEYSLDKTKQVYKYRIKGLEENWTIANESAINISQIPYGSFQLEIKGLTKHGAWSEATVMAIEHAKPFYLTRWFLIFMIILLGLLIAGIIRYRTLQLRRQADELTVQVIQRTQTIEKQKKELEKANAFKDKLFSLIAHDLKTPIEGIGNMSERLNYLIRYERYQDIRKLGVVMSKSSVNMSKLIDNLLSWTLMHKNQLQIKPKILSLEPIVKETLQLYKASVAYKLLDLDVDIQATLRTYFDENILHTILRNIIDNAVKYTNDRGQLSITAKRNFDKIILVVENSGKAISEKVIASFNHDGLEDEQNILPGLGLKLCKDLLQLSDGGLRIERKSDQFTRVVLILPSVMEYEKKKWGEESRI